MERPASRMGASILGTSQTGTGAAGRQVPGTAMRGSTMNPPGTAYKRLQTASGQKGQQPAGAGGRPVQIDARPITQQGVSGMRTAAPGGGGRQVLDKAYFINELRQKRSEIERVSQQMREELDTLEKRQTTLNSLNQRNTALSSEVRSLQEHLADYNIVLDKVGSQASFPSITQEHNVLRDRNAGQRKRIDDILTERLNTEDKTKQVEVKIADIKHQMEDRIKSMPPQQRDQYNELVAEQQKLTQDVKSFEESIDGLDKQLQGFEGELARNPLKQKAMALQEQIRSLAETRDKLQDEVRSASMSVEEQKEAVMSKVKRDNAEVEQKTQEVRELQEAIKKMEGRVNSLGAAADPSNAAEEASKREKFDELLAKDRDLNDFLDSFPSRKAAKQQERQAKEDAIIALLEKMNKLSSISLTALPSAKKFREMQDELEYKKIQLENTQVTQERLREELTQRRAELDKIDTLEDKIKQELDSLADKEKELQKEMGDFKSADDIKRRGEETKMRLEAQRAALSKRKELLRVMVAEKIARVSSKKAQLKENNVQIQIDKMESRLRDLCQTNYQMSDFIKTKESETNYQGLANKITSLTQDLNATIVRSMKGR